MAVPGGERERRWRVAKTVSELAREIISRLDQGEPLESAISMVLTGEGVDEQVLVELQVAGLRDAVDELVAMLEDRFPGIPHAPWIALRLLEGDQRIAEAISSGELGDLTKDHSASLVETEK